jgi:large subunit ribosomal protein L29
VKSREAHDLADDQVVDAIANARQNLFNLRFQHATGQLEDTAALGRAKRDLARVLTVARQRGIDVERELRRQAANA